MLDKKVAGPINVQVNKKLYSAYLYLDFTDYYEDAELNGFPNQYQVQVRKERDHTILFIQYLQNSEEKITLEVITKPDRVFEDFKGSLTAELEHENYMTGFIHDTYDTMHSARDFRIMQFLGWFVEEQGEEEKNASELAKCFDLFGHDLKGLHMLDSGLATGVYTALSLML